MAIRSRLVPTHPLPSRRQPEITPAMRAKLVDWMAEVRDEFRLHGETFFLAVHFLDRYLCAEGVGRQRFQLLGMACLWVAAKYEEVFVPHTDTVLAMAQNVYSSKDLQDMERRVGGAQGGWSGACPHQVPCSLYTGTGSSIAVPTVMYRACRLAYCQVDERQTYTHTCGY